MKSSFFMSKKLFQSAGELRPSLRAQLPIVCVNASNTKIAGLSKQLLSPLSWSFQSSVFTSGSKKCDLHNVDVSAGNFARDSDQETVLIENGCRRKGVNPKRKNTESLSVSLLGIHYMCYSIQDMLDTSASVSSAESEGWSGCDYKIDGKRVRVSVFFSLVTFSEV